MFKETRNRFRGFDPTCLCSMAGRYRQIGLSYRPVAGWESTPGLLKMFRNTGYVPNTYMCSVYLFQRLIWAPVETSAGQGGASGQQSQHEYDRPHPLQRPHNAGGPHLNHRTNHKVVFALLYVSNFYIFTRLYMSFSLVLLNLIFLKFTKNLHQDYLHYIILRKRFYCRYFCSNC